MINKQTGELPMNRFINPMALLYAIPNHTPVDTVDLLRKCGIQILINDMPPLPSKAYNPYRELAVSILLQAVDDAVYGKGKNQAEARAWLLYDVEDFQFWCEAIDLDHQEVRKNLYKKLTGQCYDRINLSRHHTGRYREGSNVVRIH